MKAIKCRASVAIALAVLAALLVGACGGSKPTTDETKAPFVREQKRLRVPDNSALRKSLKIEPVAERNVQSETAVPAVVEADPSRVMKVLTPVAGRVEKLHKVLGDPVAEGDALITLDSADFAAAQSDAAKADAAAAMNLASLERLRKLVGDDIAAKKDLEQAESDYAQSSAEAKRAWSRLGALGVARGAAYGSHYALRSPIAGYVVELLAAQGGYWNDNTAPLMTVADLSKVWVTASVQEKDISRVYPGQAARVTLNAYPDEPISGRVRDLARVLDPDTRTLKTRVVVDNPRGRFRPNMFARVVLLGEAHAAPVVPVGALVQAGFSTLVFVEVSPWIFEAREVKAGPVIEGTAEILQGLKPGERVVVKDGVLLND